MHADETAKKKLKNNQKKKKIRKLFSTVFLQIYKYILNITNVFNPLAFKLLFIVFFFF